MTTRHWLIRILLASIVLAAMSVGVDAANTAPDYAGAEKELRKEKAIIDLVHQNAEAEWLIGVKNDGSKRYGYAEYVCIILGEHNAITEGHMVRIVDYFKFMNSDGNHRDASALSSARQANIGFRRTPKYSQEATVTVLARAVARSGPCCGPPVDATNVAAAARCDQPPHSRRCMS
ncbi:MAG: hypothetical protein U1E42_09105 [Rhodospirillales bacterium]